MHIPIYPPPPPRDSIVLLSCPVAKKGQVPMAMSKFSLEVWILCFTLTLLKDVGENVLKGKRRILLLSSTQQTCYHHPPCRLDQVCQLVTSTANDCVSEGDEQRRDRQQTVWGLMEHSPLEHESTVLFQAVSVGKIIMNLSPQPCNRAEIL